MNTVAKNKIEKIINHEIEQKIVAYKKRRTNELNALVEQYEKQPSKEALEIQTKLQQNEEEKEQLEQQLKAVGFDLQYNNQLTLRSEIQCDDEYHHYWKAYFVPELTAYGKTTVETVAKLEAMARQYTLKIWAGEASAEVDLLAAFEKELAKLQT
jgi:hypothetical protein